MGEWSTSYRWESRAKTDIDRARGRGRDKRAAIGTMLSHVLRDLEERDGIARAHRNEMIDRARTHNNIVWLPDDDPAGRQRGGMRQAGPADTPESVERWIDDRVAQARHTKTRADGRVVPVAVRSDATVALEVVLQLDPEYTGPITEMTDEQRADAREKLWVMVEELRAHVGDENLAAVAEHWDEMHPHFHVFVVPMRDQKLVGAKIMGTSKAEYAQRHDEMRAALREVGYDATFERVDAGRGHEPVEVFKARRDREKKVAEKDRFYRKNLPRYKKAVQRLEKAREALAEDQETLAAEQAELPKLRQRAREEGFEEGREEGRAEGHREGLVRAKAEAQTVLDRAHVEAQRIKDEGQQKADREILDAENLIAAERRRAAESVPVYDPSDAVRDMHAATVDELAEIKMRDGTPVLDYARERAEKKFNAKFFGYPPEAETKKFSQTFGARRDAARARVAAARQQESQRQSQSQQQAQSRYYDD